jgi:hypothetical protein
MKLLLNLALLFTSQTLFAADLAIIDVRRNITLSDKDPIYKDFYINAGPGSGLKKNLVVTAIRKMNVLDAGGANSFGEILVPVGQLKIIAIYDKVAIAREFTLLSREDLPMLEQTGIMTGDKIDLKGAFIDIAKPKKVAEESTPAPTTTAAASSMAPAVVSSVAIVKTSSEIAKATPPTLPTQAPVPLSPTAQSADAKATPRGPAATEKLEKVANSGNNSRNE